MFAGLDPTADSLRLVGLPPIAAGGEHRQLGVRGPPIALSAGKSGASGNGTSDSPLDGPATAAGRRAAAAKVQPPAAWVTSAAKKSTAAGDAGAKAGGAKRAAVKAPAPPAKKQHPVAAAGATPSTGRTTRTAQLAGGGMDTPVQRDGRRGSNAPVEVKSPQKTRALALAPQQRAESPGVEMIEMQPKTRTHQQPQEERLQQQGGSARQGGDRQPLQVMNGEAPHPNMATNQVGCAHLGGLQLGGLPLGNLGVGAGMQVAWPMQQWAPLMLSSFQLQNAEANAREARQTQLLLAMCMGNPGGHWLGPQSGGPHNPPAPM